MPEQRPRVKCGVCAAFDTLDADDCQTLRDMLDNPDITNTHVVRALGMIGVSLRSSTVSRWRHDQCSCKASL